MSESLENKVVFITGASSGIGKASAQYFAENKAKLILTARRLEKLEIIAKELEKEYGAEILVRELDVSNKNMVAQVVDKLTKDWRIDILLNNAGLALDSIPMQNGSLDNWDTMIDTNIRGLLYVTHAILPSMIARSAGHIINIGSSAGHDYYPTGNVYSATKHAVKAISKSLRLDLLGTKIRVTEINPGFVHTEFSTVRWNDKARAEKFYQAMDALHAEDIADAIIYAATRPARVDISEMHVFPTCQASVNHIYRNGDESKSIFD